MGELPMNKYDHYNANDYQEYDNNDEYHDSHSYNDYNDYYDTHHNTTGDDTESDNVMMYLCGFICFTFIATHCLVHLCGIWDNSIRYRYRRIEDMHVRNEISEKTQHRRLKIKNETKIKDYDSSLLILDTGCSICLDNFKEGEKISILKCSHIFHDKCIGDWLDTQFTCPLCRLSL